MPSGRCNVSDLEHLPYDIAFLSSGKVVDEFESLKSFRAIMLKRLNLSRELQEKELKGGF